MLCGESEEKPRSSCLWMNAPKYRFQPKVYSNRYASSCQESHHLLCIFSAFFQSDTAISRQGVALTSSSLPVSLPPFPHFSFPAFHSWPDVRHFLPPLL